MLVMIHNDQIFVSEGCEEQLKTQMKTKDAEDSNKK